MRGNILITGGTGTLGHAIVRAACKEQWGCDITIYSRSEFAQAEMRKRYPDFRYILGDVRDYDRLEEAIKGHNIVIHAAALKRIPETEAQPSECYATNVLGSANVIKACQRNNVRRCIGISSDKACRAITAYGASKLAMEKLFQNAMNYSTALTLVRYGNVLASRGSVIPLWCQQAAQGKPLTITDRRMTRFWMTEREAVHAIEQALRLYDRTILVPKTAALSITDMAAIIAPDSDTHKVGLRSCEKLHEDLVHADEVVEEREGYFIIGRGEAGTSYTSEHAPRLSKEQFLEMLEEANHVDC